jgi:hypothetical protein
MVMLVNSALRRLRQEDLEFEDILVLRIKSCLKEREKEME